MKMRAFHKVALDQNTLLAGGQGGHQHTAETQTGSDAPCKSLGVMTIIISKRALNLAASSINSATIVRGLHGVRQAHDVGTTLFKLRGWHLNNVVSMPLACRTPFIYPHSSHYYIAPRPLSA